MNDEDKLKEVIQKAQHIEAASELINHDVTLPSQVVFDMMAAMGAGRMLAELVFSREEEMLKAGIIDREQLMLAASGAKRILESFDVTRDCQPLNDLLDELRGMVGVDDVQETANFVGHNIEKTATRKNNDRPSGLGLN